MMGNGNPEKLNGVANGNPKMVAQTDTSMLKT